MSTIEFKQSWQRIEKWLKENAPGIYNSLNNPASSEEIEKLESYYKISLPEDIAALYQLHNGQDDSGPGIVNFIYGFNFVPISYALDFHGGAFVGMIEEIDFPSYQSIHRDVNPSKETPLYFYPILEGHVRYSLCVDFRPQDISNVGQLIYFDTESQVAYKISHSVTDMLALFASDLESGLYSVSEDEPRWLNTSKEVDLCNWGYNGMHRLYPNGRST